MQPGFLVAGLGLLLLAIVLGIWWSGQRFWHHSLVPTLQAKPGFWPTARLVLLAGLWHLLVYSVTAVFALPWLKGAGHGGRPATPDEWQQAYFNHEFGLLLLSGLGGACALLVRGRRVAALSWLAGCLLVLAGFRGPRTYYAWESERAAASRGPAGSFERPGRKPACRSQPPGRGDFETATAGRMGNSSASGGGLIQANPTAGAARLPG